MILPQKTVEFEYPGVEGLFFSLSYLSKRELERLQKAHTKFTKNKITKTFTEELQQDAFMEEYVTKIITDWRGLTCGNIQEFLAMPEDSDPEMGVPYSEENAYALLTNSQDLDQWVSEQISDLENFRNQESKKNEES